jgi:hypothetical protein
MTQHSVVSATYRFSLVLANTLLLATYATRAQSPPPPAQPSTQPEPAQGTQSSSTTPRADAEQARHLLKIFPDAFRFQYEGTEGSVVKLKFTPNPNFRPSGRVKRAFVYLEGF